MTANELGLSKESVDYIHAIILRGREGFTSERDVTVARARLRVADGVGDEEDLSIVRQFQNVLLPHQMLEG